MSPLSWQNGDFNGVQIQTTGRRIRKNHCNAIPRYILAVDTESIRVQHSVEAGQFVHSLRLGVAITGRIVKESVVSKATTVFRSPAEFWALLEKLSGPRHTVWVIAHKLLWDLIELHFVDEFDECRLAIDTPRSKRKREKNDESDPHTAGIAVLKSPPTIIGARVIRTQGRVLFLDSLNWFQCPLREIGDAIGLCKGRLPDWNSPERDWADYCTRDAEILFRAFTELLTFVRKQDLGMFRYTVAGQAFAAYRHRFMRQEIYAHDNRAIKGIERNGYFGGRVEVFKHGAIDETVYQFDCNALFPSVMSTGFYPFRLERFRLPESYSQTLPLINWGDSIAECVLNTDEPIYPFRTIKHVLYPKGEFRTVLCGSELLHAYSRGHIIAVKSWAEYETGNLFSLYVKDLWKMRQHFKGTSNRLYESIIKLLMNGLYGKFAQLSPDWQPVPNRIAHFPWLQWVERDWTTGETTEFRSIGWQVQKSCKREERDDTLVAIATFVTSAARMRMNHFRCIAGNKNVYYQGVDSLIVNSTGKSNLELAGEANESEIGKLRLELCTNSGRIYGCSDYTLGTKTVTAGRFRQEIEREGAEEMTVRFTGERALFTGCPPHEMTEHLVPFRRTMEYTKGTVGPDGWVSPPVLSLQDSAGTSNNGAAPAARVAN